jgi:hypothetical protein
MCLFNKKELKYFVAWLFAIIKKSIINSNSKITFSFKISMFFMIDIKIRGSLYLNIIINFMMKISKIRYKPHLT